MTIKSPSELRVTDLRTIHALLNASADRERDDLQLKIRREIARRSGEVEFGEKVFELVLPLNEKGIVTTGKNAGKEVKRSLAPTLNEYGQMEPWQRKKLAEDLDKHIKAALASWPKALLLHQPRRRGVRVTRASQRTPDEISVDVIGGKMPIDRLVQASILAGDQRQHLEREPVWKLAKAGRGSFTVEVFEIVP